jgi:acetylornithine deacetylase/succinyl-diaminopimelate desuccinylase-like protein
MATVLEVARVLAPLREHMQGRLLVCAWGLHEAPGGRGQSLAGLLERGIVGDAVLNVEGPATHVATIGKGMATYEITIERPGEPVHEVQAPAELPHPLLLGLDAAEVLRTWADELRLGEDLPHVGPESLFIGQFESGDFYNRVPTRCRIVGTRRYAPGRRFADVEAEFAARLDRLSRNPATSLHLDLVRIRDGFRVSQDEPIVRALQRGHQMATGDELPIGGFTAVGDVSYFVNEGGVPAVYFGCGMERAHATPEYIALDRLERQARVLVAVSACYLSM